MNLLVTVTHMGALAHFKIRKEASGIYYADMEWYEGEAEHSPPAAITLIRGIRQWKGSCENEVLLNQLGERIEEEYKNSEKARDTE